MPILEKSPSWLRTGINYSRDELRVDREKGIIYGYNMAQLGPFKSDGRGEFDSESLDMIVSQVNALPKGVKSRFTHPGLSADGLGKFLGRGRNARRDGSSAKADLYLDPSSRKTPSGDLGGYVMDLAESDPEAFGSSLVLDAEKKFRIDEKGRPLVGPDGEELPPLWYPKRIHASDVVDEGDAVHSGFLSADCIDFDNLPDAELRQGMLLLDSTFAGQPRDVVESRLNAFVARYCNLRFGESGPDVATLQRKLRNKMLDIELSTR